MLPANGTYTKSGLWVKALLDTREYEPGQKITDEEMRTLQRKPHKFHGDWNHSLEPRRIAPAPNGGLCFLTKPEMLGSFPRFLVFTQNPRKLPVSSLS